MPHVAHGAIVGAPHADRADFDSTAAAAFVATAVVGGGNAVAIKFGLTELAPMWGAALRFLSASALLLVYVAITRHALPTERALVGVLVFGVLAFGLPFAFAYYALTQVSAGTTQVALSLVPLFTVGLSAAQGVERLQPRSVIGAVAAAGGIALIFFDSIGAGSIGALAGLLAAALCIAQATVTVKRFPRVSPLVENGIGMALGGLMLLALSFLFGEPKVLPSGLGAQLSLGYLVVFGSMIMFGLYLFVIGRWGPSRTSYVLLLMPLVTILAGYVLLGETPTPAFAIGAAVILGGVWLGAFAHRREKAI